MSIIDESPVAMQRREPLPVMGRGLGMGSWSPPLRGRPCPAPSGGSAQAASFSVSRANRPSASRASAIAASAASGPKASFSARTKVTSSMPMKPSRVRMCGFLAVHRRARALAVEAAAALDHHRLLALEQPLRAVLGVAEGDAGAQHMVEPGLERRAHPEIVHRRGDDEEVGLRPARRPARRTARAPPARPRSRARP